jgi:long-chain fatty acid transport protein
MRTSRCSFEAGLPAIRPAAIPANLVREESMSHKRLRHLALAIAGVAVASQAQATDGYFANGYGMKSIGMGGAAVAVAQEPFGGAVNPGAMSFLGNEVQVGVSWFSPHRDVERSGSGQAGIDGSADSDSKHFFIPEFGINWKYRPNLALGVTVYGNGGMNTDFPGGQISAQSACGAFRGGQGAPYNLLCGSGRLGVDLIQVMLAPYASWQALPGHSIGIAPIFAYQRFRAEGLQAFDNPAFTNSPGNVTNQGHDTSTGTGVRIGYMGQITPQFAVGAVYSSKVSMSEFDKYKGLFTGNGGFDIPSSYTIGLSFKPTPRWLVAVDYERIQYDDIPSVNNPGMLIGYCAPPQLGGAGLRQYCLGASEGAGFGWQPVDVWKIGIQYAVNESLTLRAGYNHSDNPIGSSDVTFNMIAPGVVKDQWTLGMTYRLDAASELTGMFMYAERNDVAGPSLFVGFGAPPTTTERIGMKQYQAGLAYTRRF